MIELDESLLIGEGRNRQCFRHPLRSDRCIKVLKPRSKRKTQQRESRYFRSLVKRGVSWDMVTPILEEIPTNFGKGIVFELVLDHDGQISKTLDYYLNLGDESVQRQLVIEIEQLKQYLLQQNIVFRDLNTQNILWEEYQPGKFQLKVIDGIGHNDYLPLCEYSSWYGRRKIRRTWNRKRDYWFSRYEAVFESITPYSV